MKNVLTGIGIVVAVVLLVLVFRFGKKQSDAEYKELKSKFDSIAALPPEIDTVTVVTPPDTVVKWYAKEVPVPVPVPGEPELNFYDDSLVTDEVAVYVKDTIRGFLINRSIGYKLFVPKKITETITITEKVPVLVSEPTDMNGVLIGTGIGGGSEFAWSVGGAYKYGRSQFGVDYLRFGSTNNWLLSYRYLLFKTK